MSSYSSSAGKMIYRMVAVLHTPFRLSNSTSCMSALYTTKADSTVSSSVTPAARAVDTRKTASSIISSSIGKKLTHQVRTVIFMCSLFCSLKYFHL